MLIKISSIHLLFQIKVRPIQRISIFIVIIFSQSCIGTCRKFILIFHFEIFMHQTSFFNVLIIIKCSLLIIDFGSCINRRVKNGRFIFQLEMERFYPYITSLQVCTNLGECERCTATLISKNIVLTAASCFCKKCVTEINVSIPEMIVLFSSLRVIVTFLYLP